MKNIQEFKVLTLVLTMFSQSTPTYSNTAGEFGVVGTIDSDTKTNKKEKVQPPMSNNDATTFQQTIQKVIAMPENNELQSRLARHGLNVLNLTWEDTGRNHDSAVGPNISDVTLQVREPVERGVRTHLLPVIRYPNFTDKTADIVADKLWVKVGNQNKDGDVISVPLTELLSNLQDYISNPESLLGDGNFLAERDTHFLVSAQHVFVPLPKSGKVEFNPVIYNYQSYSQNPAVMTLLVTRQGTSMAVIENDNDDRNFKGHGQQLFFNNQGQKTTFTAERKSDVKERVESGNATNQDQGALEKGADMLLIIQVPLKHKQIKPVYEYTIMNKSAPMPASEPAPDGAAASQRMASDVEEAVIGHGQDLGPVDEGNKLKLERDELFPIRVTVQYYKATSNGVISDEDLNDAKKQIDRVYAEADYVGSLVVPESERSRPTEWIKGRTKTIHNSKPNPNARAQAVDEKKEIEPTASAKTEEKSQSWWETVKSWF
ncbi:hypothetical protein MEO40_25325 [Dolichospermum sp. ST_sed1]|nr:hypothetical protein [Dolichospermum sp. ST_sed1]